MRDETFKIMFAKDSIEPTIKKSKGSVWMWKLVLSQLSLTEDNLDGFLASLASKSKWVGDPY